MLFLLSSAIQSGKTRWLEGLVEELRERGVECAGVLAPGIWREVKDSAYTGESVAGGVQPLAFEKLGIENVLLPQDERLLFGTKRMGDGGPRDSQSSRANLGWDISDDAIRRVNEHFEALAREAADASRAASRPRLLVVDELGVLELQRGGGLVSALALLDAGPTRYFPHALAVVRPNLLETAVQRLCDPWGACKTIAPDDEAKQLVLACLCNGT